MSDYDLITIIGNLLDNALEYSTNHHFDSIDFYICQHADSLDIIVQNPLAEPVDIRKLGSSSTKTEKGHGYGISNVKEVTRKYHGTIVYEMENDGLKATVQLSL